MKPRKTLQRMAPYPAAAEGRSGFLRLDLNENTEGCSPRVLKPIRQGITRPLLATYPEYGKSLARIAASFGRKPEETLLTNGVDEAILLLFTAFLEPGRRGVVAEPCFDMYRFYATPAGVEGTACDARRVVGSSDAPTSNASRAPGTMNSQGTPANGIRSALAKVPESAT